MKGLSVIVNIALVPLSIKSIHSNEYGIWLTLSSIIAWISFFDVGFGHGLRNKFAEARARNDTEILGSYVSTTYASLIVIFVPVLIIFLSINRFIPWADFLNVHSLPNTELVELTSIMLGLFCVQMVLKTINIIYIADQKPYRAAMTDTMGLVLTLVAVWIMYVSDNASLINLALATGIGPLIALGIATAIGFGGRYLDLLPSLNKIKWTQAREILQLGVKFFVIQFSAIVIFQTSNVLIARLIGPDSVTVYNIAYKYFFMVSMLFSIVLTPYWSASTDAYVKGDFVWLKQTISGLNKVYLISVIVVILMTIFATSVYKLWIGSEIQVPLMVSILMAIHVLLFNRFNLFISIINGIGKVKLQLIANIGISILFIPLAYSLVKEFGIVGIILANILVATIHAVLGQVQVSKLLHNNARGLWNK
ncbi:MAG: MATE family efflux transporter [Saprospiraceae bacterium]